VADGDAAKSPSLAELRGSGNGSAASAGRRLVKGVRLSQHDDPHHREIRGTRMADGPMNRAGVAAALGAAALFGLAMPLAKLLLGTVSPWMLAGLMYLGSGIGITAARLIRDRGWRGPHLAGAEWSWLAAATGVGGLAAPVLLMFGLSRSSAAMASLLLNLEVVLTASIAWLVFREHAGARVVFAMAAIVAGAVLLSWPGAGGFAAGNAASGDGGALAIFGACACWAIDNNLTRRVSHGDALFIAGSKGLAAGPVNLALAFAIGTRLPPSPALAGGLLLGLLGYGVSQVLYVLALREFGSARTGGYFAIAPFIGAAFAIAILGEPATPVFYAAAALMALGVGLQLSERHDHEHTHEPLVHAHAHPHTHDEHHRHAHPDGWNGVEPHSHEHRHEPLRHVHPHYPDTHHRHTHD